MGSVWGDKAHKREGVHHCNVCDKAFKSLRTFNQHQILQHSGNVFVCKGCDKKCKTNKSINRHKKLYGLEPHQELLHLLHVEQRGRRGKVRFCSAPGRGQTFSSILTEIYFLVFNNNKQKKVCNVFS